jgi:hypothetical protein
LLASPSPALLKAEAEKLSIAVTANGFCANMILSMTDPLSAGESGSELAKGKAVEGSGKADSGKLSPGSDAGDVRADAPLASNKLTPEEQMALFEKDLKENDWGHQPC